MNNNEKGELYVKNNKSGSYNKTSKSTPSGYKAIEEGYAKIIYKDKTDAFYNNVQIVNRDLSTLIIQEYINELGTEVNILEALSATGLRSIRYWKEIKGINKIIANDLSPTAFETIKKNVEFNEISQQNVVPNLADANSYLDKCTEKNEKFDIIDLDPYGSSIPFLHSSLKNIKNGGLLCVTCTDLIVLTGSQVDNCFGRYGIFPLKGIYCHEWSLRTLMGSMQTIASQLKKAVIPIACCFINFYIRVFVKVIDSPKIVKDIYKKYGYIFQCVSCPVYYNISLDNKKKKDKYPNVECIECGSQVKLGGPIYTACMHNVEFLEKTLKSLEIKKNYFSSYKKIKGLLSVIKDELPDVPLFYHIPSVCKILKCPTPKLTIIQAAITNAGYKCSLTHCKAGSLKTDCPASIFLDFFREYVKTIKYNPKNDISKSIIAKPSKIKADFKVYDKSKFKKNIGAFLPNPEKNWGPKAMAKTQFGIKLKEKEEEEEEEEEREIPKKTGEKRKRNSDDDHDDVNPNKKMKI